MTCNTIFFIHEKRMYLCAILRRFSALCEDNQSHCIIMHGQGAYAICMGAQVGCNGLKWAILKAGWGCSWCARMVLPGESIHLAALPLPQPAAGHCEQVLTASPVGQSERVGWVSCGCGGGRVAGASPGFVMSPSGSHLAGQLLAAGRLFAGLYSF